MEDAAQQTSDKRLQGGKGPSCEVPEDPQPLEEFLAAVQKNSEDPHIPTKTTKAPSNGAKDRQMEAVRTFVGGLARGFPSVWVRRWPRDPVALEGGQRPIGTFHSSWRICFVMASA